MTTAAVGLRTAGFGGVALADGPELVRENPARVDEVVGVVATTDPDGIDALVDDAARAQVDWAATPIEDRLDRLRLGARAIADLAEDLAPVLAAELGKPLADSAGEAQFAAAFLEWVCDAAPAVCAEQTLDDPAGRVLLLREPYGAVAAVVPWNAPLILSSLKVAPALATGNTIIVKPSPIAPFAVTAALSALAAQLPPGVLSVVHGAAEVGAALVGHRSIRKVAFTGGAAVAHEVLRGCAETLTPAMLELGGNDPALILDDLTFSDEVMERLVFGVYLTSGQVCMAAKRLYVPVHRLDEFVEAFEATAARVLVCGDPMESEVTVGPVATAAQRDRVAGLVSDASGRGASVVQLGRTTSGFDPGSGYFVRPTLVRDVPDDAPIVVEEQFGPTVPVLGYGQLNEAVSAANASELGLASSVWSDDVERAFDVGRRLEAGMTFVNCHNRAGMSLRVPFGGVKRSGFGREFGELGIAEFTQTHALHLPGVIRDGGGPGHSRANAYPT